MPRPNGTQTRTFVYDSNQRLQSETHPESGNKTYTYNSDGTLATRTDARHQVTKYTYDSYQRVGMIQYYPYPNNPTTEDTCQRVTISYDTNSIDSTFSQNAWGRPTTTQWGGPACSAIKNTTFTQMYSYAPAGLTTKKRLRIGRSTGTVTGDMDVAYSYDSEGRATSMAYPTTYTLNTYNNPVAHPGPIYTYTYDAMGRPATMVDNQSPQYTWAQQTAYNAANQMTQFTWGAGYVTNGGTGQQVPVTTAETRAYNVLSQLTSIRGVSGLNGATYVLNYNYSGTTNNGRIGSQYNSMTGETVSYSYDPLNRLSAASGAGWGTSYTYDGFGNLTDKTVTAGSAPPWHVLVSATTNRITTASYDENGNTTQTPGGTIYGYDGENRLTSGGGEGHAHGPDNLRVWKLKTDGTDELHVYGVFGELVGTYPIFVIPNPNGMPSGSYGIGAGPTNLYFAGMRLGTQGRLGSSGAFYPYGEEVTATQQNTFKFATYYRDATTLDYAKNRYYSSTMGRFMPADPYRNSAGAGDPGSWNRYAYTRNDPVNRVDPFGLDDCTPSAGVDFCVTGTAALPTQLYYLTTAGRTGHGIYAFMSWFQLDKSRGGGTGRMAQQQVANAAALAATDRRYDPDCAGLFLGPDANTPEQRKILSGQLQYAVDQSDVRVISQTSLPAGTPPNVPAFTKGTLGFIYVVSERSFFTGQLSEKPLCGAFQGLSLNQTQQLMMIHVFLHWEGIGDDNANQVYTLPNGDKVTGSEGISAEVRKKCFK
jgi:RHS repeat-associated protein